MNPDRSAAWHELEVQGSLIYFLLVISIFIVALTMLLLANISPQGLIVPSALIAISLACSLQTYRRKKTNRPAGVYAWVAASIFIIMPIAQKFNYVTLYGWEVALSSYNSSVMIIIAVVINQFLYDKRLFTVLAVAALAGWASFLMTAVLSGAPMSIQSVQDGRGVSQFVVLREVFIMLVSTIVWFAVYRMIPITENYDRTTTEQRHIIEDNNAFLEAQVRERTVELFRLNGVLRERNSHIEAELDMARLILNNLMPATTMKFEGLDFFAHNVFMDKVGGDFFGFKLLDNSFEMLLADASGHGLHAAFLSLITKMTYDGIIEPGNASATLMQLNRSVCRSAVRGHFVTAVCCTVDLSARVARFSTAGHWPCVIHRRGRGDIEEIAARGIPLGWKSDYAYPLVERSIFRGDRIVLYTDGIIECADTRGAFFGAAGLYGYIRDNPVATPRELTEGLLSHLRMYTGTESFKDDISILVCDITS